MVKLFMAVIDGFCMPVQLTVNDTTCGEPGAFPESEPVVELNVSHESFVPPGSIAHRYELLPPAAVMLIEYAFPIAALGSGVGFVIVITFEYTLNEKLTDARFVVSLASVTLSRKVTGPMFGTPGTLFMLPYDETDTHPSFVPVGSLVQM